MPTHPGPPALLTCGEDVESLRHSAAMLRALAMRVRQALDAICKRCTGCMDTVEIANLKMRQFVEVARTLKTLYSDSEIFFEGRASGASTSLAPSSGQKHVTSPNTQPIHIPCTETDVSLVRRHSSSSTCSYAQVGSGERQAEAAAMAAVQREGEEAGRGFDARRGSKGVGGGCSRGFSAQARRSQ